MNLEFFAITENVIKSRRVVVISTVFLLSGCFLKNTIEKDHNISSTNMIVSDSINNKSVDNFKDQIDTTLKNFHLHIYKGSENVLLKYKMVGNKKEQSVEFKYFNYSEIVFPKKAIGIINDDRNYTESNLYLIGDSILILPLISFYNSLSIYFVDLKREELIAEDIRTSVSFLWIDETSSNILTSSTPEYVDEKDSFKYKFIKSRILSTGIKREYEHDFIFKEEINDNVNEQFKIAQKMFR